MRLALILFASGILLIAGCDTKPDNAPVAPHKVSVTADELLVALNGQVFTVLTPDKVDPNAFAGLALKYPDGTISPFGSSNRLKPNQELKIILLDPKEGLLRYTILGDDHYVQQGESRNFPGFVFSAPNSKSTRIGVDQPLIRFATGSSLSFPLGKLREGEFDLMFHIQSTDDEQVARSGGGKPSN